MLSLTKPEIVEAIHRAYLEAGADIIGSSHLTGHASRSLIIIWKELLYEIICLVCQIAKKVAQNLHTQLKQTQICNSFRLAIRRIYLTRCECPGFRAITFDELVANYYEQASGLMDGNFSTSYS